jgi:hypothetical protein
MPRRLCEPKLGPRWGWARKPRSVRGPCRLRRHGCAARPARSAPLHDPRPCGRRLLRLHLCRCSSRLCRLCSHRTCPRRGHLGLQLCLCLCLRLRFLLSAVLLSARCLPVCSGRFLGVTSRLGRRYPCHRLPGPRPESRTHPGDRCQPGGHLPCHGSFGASRAPNGPRPSLTIPKIPRRQTRPEHPGRRPRRSRSYLVVLTWLPRSQCTRPL